MTTIQRLFVTLALSLLAACRPLISPVALPPGLQAGGEHYPITGGVNLFQHTVKFGPYAARHAWAGVHSEDVLQRPTVNNDQIEHTLAKQEASFDFSVPSGGAFRGECWRERDTFTQYFRRGLFAKGKETQPPRVLESNRRTWCRLERQNGGVIELATDGPNSNQVVGSIIPLTISTLAWRSSPYETASGMTGYSLEAGPRSVAAVDLSWSASVTLLAELGPDQRDQAAAVCMALYMTTKMYD